MTCIGAAGFCEQKSVQVAAHHRHQEAHRPEAAHLQVPITYVLTVPVRGSRSIVLDPYSLNPDLAKNLNPEPKHWPFCILSGYNVHNISYRFGGSDLYSLRVHLPQHDVRPKTYRYCGKNN